MLNDVLLGRLNWWVRLEPAGGVDIMFQHALVTQLSCGFSSSVRLCIQEKKEKFNIISLLLQNPKVLVGYDSEVV